MLYENNHTLDCGVLGKKQALIQFDFDENHRFNESVYISYINYWFGDSAAKETISNMMEEIRGTREYKEAKENLWK